MTRPYVDGGSSIVDNSSLSRSLALRTCCSNPKSRHMDVLLGKGNTMRRISAVDKADRQRHRQCGRRRQAGRGRCLAAKARRTDFITTRRIRQRCQIELSARPSGSQSRVAGAQASAVRPSTQAGRTHVLASVKGGLSALELGRGSGSPHVDPLVAAPEQEEQKVKNPAMRLGHGGGPAATFYV